jgi:hypothetical protein
MGIELNICYPNKGLTIGDLPKACYPNNLNKGLTMQLLMLQWLKPRPAQGPSTSAALVLSPRAGLAEAMQSC